MIRQAGALKRRPVGVEAEPTPDRAGAEGRDGGRGNSSRPKFALIGNCYLLQSKPFAESQFHVLSPGFGIKERILHLSP